MSESVRDIPGTDAPGQSTDSARRNGPAALALIANSKPVEVLLTLVIFSILQQSSRQAYFRPSGF